MSNSPSDPWRRRFAGVAGPLLLALGSTGPASAADIEPRVRAAALRDGAVDALLVFGDQSMPLTPLRPAADYHARRRGLVAGLQARARHDQRDVRAWLDAQRIPHRDLWIANLIEARLPRAALDDLERRGDIARVVANPRIPLRLPPAEPLSPADIEAMTASGIAWGVAKIDAPLVWAQGFTGQGVVIGGEDTGYAWTHPALQPHYRGWTGSTAVHAYNWHDAIHDATGNPCGNDASEPCDDNSHGTHTAGTFVGNDGAGNAIGVAPGAKWIGCRNMDRGTGTPARYIECMQWMLAPTDGANANPDPDRAPDVVSNSWACPDAEGCTVGNEIAAAVANVVAGGIFYVAAAQNGGPGCNTIADPPATYDGAFDVGATDSNDVLAGFSSRGPVAGGSLIRPDLSAPGVSVYSAVPPGGFGFKSGTSMAAPHVAGTVALLLSAFPALKGHPAAVARILRATAATQGVTDGLAQTCGGTPSTTWPNNMVGYGRLDAWNAYREVIFVNDFDQ